MECRPDDTAIYVKDLKKCFKKRKGLLPFISKVVGEWALKGISFTVRDHEIYGLLGPNGSGKSTLVRILSTLLIPDGGTVCIMGHPLEEDERWIRRHIGRVSVDAAFYKKLSARENLLYAAQLYGIPLKEAESRARAILAQLEFDVKKFDDSLEDMSRGMQQKISVARALLINPPLMLLDEPTTGLDPRSRRDVEEYLLNLRRDKGTTILLTTHDIAEAERMCDRIGLLDHGELIAEGTVAEIMKQSEASTLEDAYLKLTGGPIEGNTHNAEAA